MKRKASDAGLPWDTGYVIRMDVFVNDYITGNEPHTFHLQLSPRDSIDTAKYLLSMQIWERFGRFPEPATFQLHQRVEHLRFTTSVMCAATLVPVLFVRSI